MEVPTLPSERGPITQSSFPNRPSNFIIAPFITRTTIITLYLPFKPLKTIGKQEEIGI